MSFCSLACRRALYCDAHYYLPPTPPVLPNCSDRPSSITTQAQKAISCERKIEGPLCKIQMLPAVPYLFHWLISIPHQFDLLTYFIFRTKTHRLGRQCRRDPLAGQEASRHDRSVRQDLARGTTPSGPIFPIHRWLICVSQKFDLITCYNSLLFSSLFVIG